MGSRGEFSEGAHVSDQMLTILATPPALSPAEEREIAREVTRLRHVIAAYAAESRVEISTNPSGILGEYVSLLIEGVAQSLAWPAVVPRLTQWRYRRTPWFQFRRRPTRAGGPPSTAGRRGRRRSRSVARG